jgi:hypothetical protein
MSSRSHASGPCRADRQERPPTYFRSRHQGAGLHFGLGPEVSHVTHIEAWPGREEKIRGKLQE